MELLDGRMLAQQIRNELAEAVKELTSLSWHLDMSTNLQILFVLRFC